MRGWILLLLMWLTLPITNTKSTKYIKNFVTNNYLCSITKELMWCSKLNDVIFEGINKPLVCFDTINISDLCFSANKKDSSSRTIIDCWSIRVDNVTGNRLIASVNI